MCTRCVISLCCHRCRIIHQPRVNNALRNPPLLRCGHLIWVKNLCLFIFPYGRLVTSNVLLPSVLAAQFRGPKVGYTWGRGPTGIPSMGVRAVQQVLPVFLS